MRKESMDMSNSLDFPRPFLGDAIKIEAIKDLARTFAKEVEALGHGRTQTNAEERFNFNEEVKRLETDLIRYALLRTGGHQRRAARFLGLKPTTLNAKMKRYSILPENADEHLAQTGSADSFADESE